MYVRARTLLAFSILFTVACGGAAAGGAAGLACKAGDMSVPKSANDPCKQTGTSCGFSGGMGVAMCDATKSTWGQCICVLPQGSTQTTAPAVTTPMCGNGVVESSIGEQCEMGITSTTCAAMQGPGATGLVMCINCKYDFSMCHGAAAAPAAGTGATAQAGTGM